jgi:hypothetical protein
MWVLAKAAAIEKEKATVNKVACRFRKRKR